MEPPAPAAAPPFAGPVSAVRTELVSPASEAAEAAEAALAAEVAVAAGAGAGGLR